MTVASLIMRLLVVAIIAALVGGAALGLSRREEKTYTASTKILTSAVVRPELQVLGAAFARPSSDPETFAATQAELARSYSVAQEVALKHKELGLSADKIFDRISADAIEGTDAVRIEATGPTPRAAQDLVRFFRHEFILSRERADKRRAVKAERALRASIRQLPRSERRTLRGTVRDQLGALAVLRRVGSGQPEVIDAARATSSPSSPKTERNTIFGVIFGAILGVGLIALRSEMKRERAGDKPAASGS